MAAMRFISAAEQRQGKAIVRRFSMSETELDALSFIIDHAQPTTGEIGRKLALTSGTITGVVDRLVKRGLRGARTKRDRVLLEVLQRTRQCPAAAWEGWTTSGLFSHYLFMIE
jgi:DNA-binding MarR family transcriptional regulator